MPEHVTKDVIADAFKKAYAGEPFIRISSGRQPEVIAVYGSNYVEVGFAVSEPFAGRRSVVCFSAIDNLVKGGAGQSVQAFNVMMGFEEAESLRQPGQWP